jgi:hypothetical protein
MDNVQQHNICNNARWTQTFRSYVTSNITIICNERLMTEYTLRNVVYIKYISNNRHCPVRRLRLCYKVCVSQHRIWKWNHGARFSYWIHEVHGRPFYREKKNTASKEDGRNVRVSLSFKSHNNCRYIYWNVSLETSTSSVSWSWVSK